MTYFTDSEELRQLGRMFGITEPDAGHEAIGDEITSRVETLQNALRSLIAHWDEFGPEHGFGEAVDYARVAAEWRLAKPGGTE